MKNIVLFVTGVTVIAWAANYAASIIGSGDPAMTSVGMSIAAMGPLFMAVVLRKWDNQGWDNAGLRMRFRHSRRWYAFSLLYTPMVIVFIAAISVSLGVAQLTPDHTAAVSSMLLTFGITFVPMLFLSIGEEFGWRGYLEPNLWSVNQRTVLNHIFIGVIWGFWHFPLLLFAPSSETNPVQLSMVVLGCVALAIIYGQVRLRSGSVWPCVILHAVSNAAFISIASSKLLRFNEGVSAIVSFNSTSVAIIGVWLTTCLILLTLIRKTPATLLDLPDHYSR
jgi:membrane protease YdiL (CAAX protease family)